MSPNRAAYDPRSRRIADLIELRQPDWMPLVLYATFWLAKYAAISHRDLMCDYERTKAISGCTVLKFDPDAYVPLVLRSTVRPRTSRVRQYAG